MGCALLPNCAGAVPPDAAAALAAQTVDAGPRRMVVMSTKPAAAPADREDVPPGASPEERIEFLKQSIEFTEGSIRAYDTKSQIAMAAFVLSMSPLWSILNATCPHVASRPIVAVLVGAFIGTIMSYGAVLWPIHPLHALLEKARAKGLFFIHDPVPAAATYAERLKDMSVEAELTAETLKLSFIRASKGRRFRYALWATAAFYAFVFATFLVLRRCA